jgi:uncharacterized protein YqjF (DUF2071 family)
VPPSLRELLEAPARQAGAVEHVEHRPWPLSSRSWVIAQTWERLLFAHWRCDPAAVEALLPDGLELELHDGAAWVGVVPFRVEATRLRGLPPLPRVSGFLELNVRTCVTHGGKPGIWFFSLDASSLLAVEAAQLTYRLPYRRARMELAERDGWIEYGSERVSEPERRFRGRYRAQGDFFRAEPGSLEAFLVERYCLYAAGADGALYRAEIHHEPWSLQEAEAELEDIAVVPPELELEGEPLLHVAARIDTLIWPLEPAGTATL